MGEEATRPKTTPPISAQVLLYMSATADHPAAQLSLGAMVWSRRASTQHQGSRSIAPTGGGRAAAGGSRLESLFDSLDSQLGLESWAKGPERAWLILNRYIYMTVHSRTRR